MSIDLIVAGGMNADKSAASTPAGVDPAGTGVKAKNRCRSYRGSIEAILV